MQTQVMHQLSCLTPLEPQDTLLHHILKLSWMDALYFPFLNADSDEM